MERYTVRITARRLASWWTDDDQHVSGLVEQLLLFREVIASDVLSAAMAAVKKCFPSRTLESTGMKNIYRCGDAVVVVWPRLTGVREQPFEAEARQNGTIYG